MASASQQNAVKSAHTPSASTSNDPSSSTEELNWDDDKWFNVYIWDYCVKRGYSNTARGLVEEAKLGPNPRPPINAKQGLLYEWWSVFWVLYNAKNSSQGPEDAMVYMQNHSAQARMHQVPGMMQRYPNGALPGVPGAMRAIPNSLAPGAPPGHPNQLPNAHTMPNGIGPGPPGQQQPGQPQGQGPHSQQAPVGGQPQPPQVPPPLGFPAHIQQQQQQQNQPQPNGLPGHGRPSIAGQVHTGRPQVPFYQSPTMAHPQAGATSGPPPPYSGPGPLGGGLPPNMYPQQHMRGMPPPGGPNGVNGVAGSPGFPQGSAGMGSRAPTPAQTAGGSITQPSPSTGHRAVPATPPSFGGSSGVAVPGGRGPPFDQIAQLSPELQKIDPATMNELRQELGLGNKEPLAMTLDERNRLLNAFKQRNAPGPSNPTRPQQGRGSKRNSVSPGDEHAEIPTKEHASPPAPKRARRSPEQPAPPAPGSAGPMQPQGGPSNANQNLMGGMYHPNMMPNGMRPGGPPFTPQMSAMGIGQGPPGMMMPPGVHAGMVNQQQMQAFQKNPQPFHSNFMHKTGSADPQQHQQMQQPSFGSDPNQGRPGPPQFAGGQRPNMNQGKMLPPSSPATAANANGQGKPPQTAQAKQEGGGGNGGGIKIENSPRNGPPPPPPPPSGSSGPSPPIPAPGSAQAGTSVPSPSHSGQSRPTTSTSNPPSGGTSSGPASAAPLPAPPASAPPAPTAADPMPTGYDFMNTFDDFTAIFGRSDGLDASMLERDDSLDFTSEYGNWLNGDTPGIDMMR